MSGSDQNFAANFRQIKRDEVLTLSFRYVPPSGDQASKLSTSLGNLSDSMRLAVCYEPAHGNLPGEARVPRNLGTISRYRHYYS